MNEDTVEVARLESERARLMQEIADHERRGRQIAWIALPVAIAVAVLIAAAIVAGQLSLEGLIWITLLGGLVAYLLTREIRWSGKTAFVFEIVMLLSGHAVWARDDIHVVRKRLAACDARTAELKGSP